MKRQSKEGLTEIDGLGNSIVDFGCSTFLQGFLAGAQHKAAYNALIELVHFSDLNTREDRYHKRVDPLPQRRVRYSLNRSIPRSE